MGDNYSVSTSAAPGWAPRLYTQLAAWLKGRVFNSLGYFELEAAKATPRGDWSKQAGARVKRGAFCFARLPDGSELWLVNVSPGAPTPVVLNGSEIDVAVVADSFEAFVHALAKGDTGVDDIDHVDEEDAREARAARQALQAWLKAKKIKVPKAPRFDLEEWLGHAGAGKGAGKTPPAPADGERFAAPADGERFAGDAEALRPLKLSPTLAELISLIGRRADDPVLFTYVERMGKKCPPTLTDSKWVTLSKLRVDLLFDLDPDNKKYPPVPKGKSFIPYLTTLHIEKSKLGVPFGVSSASTAEELSAKFGRPSKHGNLARWHVPLIAARDVVLSHYGPDDSTIYLRIKADDEKVSRPR